MYISASRNATPTKKQRALLDPSLKFFFKYQTLLSSDFHMIIQNFDFNDRSEASFGMA